jgi:tRNA modification GTPase
MPFGETIAAPATPAGESALALVRASGPLVPALSAAVLGHPPDSPTLPRVATFGAYHAITGEILDQVVLTRFAAPASSTGEDVLEITAHGNPLLVQRILQDLFARGCRPAEPGEFTRTAFTNGKLDLSQAEAVSDLIRARSDGALRAARRQLDGELSRRVRDFSQRLLQIQAEIEAYIDFPEEDLPAENSTGPRAAIAALNKDIETLLATARFGALLRDGLHAVIAGPPNAGKSSLLNALLGRPRAIVSPEPGTTRDFIEDRFLVGPYSIQITDTAGLRDDPPGAIEREGIARTLEKIASADFLLLVIDSAAEPPVLSQIVLDAIHPKSTLVVENKTDLSDSKNRQDFLSECMHICLSLKTGDGLDRLRAALQRAIEQDFAVSQDDLVLTSARHVEALTRARDGLVSALAKLAARDPAELAASDLRQALDALGEILGLSSVEGASPNDRHAAHEAMLDRLFATFCIGK